MVALLHDRNTGPDFFYLVALPLWAAAHKVLAGTPSYLHSSSFLKESLEVAHITLIIILLART